MSFIGQHYRALARAVTRLAGQPANSILGALVIGTALALPAGGQLLLSNFLGLARGITGTPQISLFMSLEASEAEVAEVGARLKAHRDAASVIHVPREAALKRLRASDGLAEVLESLPRNPFPDAFIVSPASDDPALFARLEQEFGQLPKVEHVQLDSAWVKRLHALFAMGRSAVMLLAALLGTALVVVTFNTIRLQILTQREEIGVSRLLGASDGFIRRPFYYYAALQGALGGLFAWGIVAAAVAVLADPATELAAAYDVGFALRGLDATDVGVLVGCAAALGWLGAALSVRRHLRDA